MECDLVIQAKVIKNTFKDENQYIYTCETTQVLKGEAKQEVMVVLLPVDLTEGEEYIFLGVCPEGFSGPQEMLFQVAKENSVFPANDIETITAIETFIDIKE